MSPKRRTISATTAKGAAARPDHSRPAQLAIFLAYLRRHNIGVNALSRACGHNTPSNLKWLSRAIHHCHISQDAIRDVETVLVASGYPVPADLWVDTNNINHKEAAPRTLYTLNDHRIIAAPPYSPLRAARVAHTQISIHQILQEDHMQPLTPEARKHFGLSLDPFRDEIRQREDIFWTREHKAVLDAMLTAARRQSFLAIIGEVGSGKTLVKREFYEQRPDTCRVIEPLFPDKRRITANNLLDAILCDLCAIRGDEAFAIPTQRERKARKVREVLEALEKEGETAVLVLDEAHDYSKDALRALKRLHEMERGFARLLGIILIGQLELVGRLVDPTIREVEQRCSQYVMRGLGNQAADYLAHKLTRAGAKIAAIFDDSSIKAMERATTYKLENRKHGPYPLLLNVVAIKSMNAAARLGEPRVTAEIVDQAIGQEVR